MNRDKELKRGLVLLASLALFIVVLIQVLNGTSSQWEDPLRYFFYDLRNESLTGVVIVITNMADVIFIVALCVLLLIIPSTRIKFGVPLSAGALGVTLLNQILKHSIDRPRPDITHLVEESGFSFPSGHSVTSFLFYGLAIWLVNRHVENKTLRIVLTLVLIIPMFLIGPTRVYLGVHYPTDVLAGWCIASFGIIVIIEVIDRKGSKRIKKGRKDMSTNRPMRKQDRAVTDPKAINAIIAQMDAIRLGFFDGEEVYIVPLSFGFAEEDGRYTFYMHGAKAGRKADLVRQCDKAGFELDRTIQVKTDPAACDHTVEYCSVIGHGSIEEVTDAVEKKKGLDLIMKHNTGKSEWEYPDKMIEATLVIKMSADWITCKVHE